jgi:transposase
MAKQNSDPQSSSQDGNASRSAATRTYRPSAGNYYSEPFKADAVRLVTHEGYTIAQAAAAVGVSEKSLRQWHRHRTESASSSQASSADASTEAENRRLREQLRQAEMERDILKKAATFFANDANTDSPSSKGKR